MLIEIVQERDDDLNKRWYLQDENTRKFLHNRGFLTPENAYEMCRKISSLIPITYRYKK